MPDAAAVTSERKADFVSYSALTRQTEGCSSQYSSQSKTCRACRHRRILALAVPWSKLEPGHLSTGAPGCNGAGTTPIECNVIICSVATRMLLLLVKPYARHGAGAATSSKNLRVCLSHTHAWRFLPLAVWGWDAGWLWAHGAGGRRLIFPLCAGRRLGEEGPV